MRPASNRVNGDLSPGSFMSFFGAMMLMLQPLRRITNINAVLQRGIAAGDSLFRIIDEPDEIDSGTVIGDNVRGTVEFRNVSFSYGGRSPVLDDLSFKVEAGKIACHRRAFRQRQVDARRTVAAVL